MNFAMMIIEFILQILLIRENFNFVFLYIFQIPQTLTDFHWFSPTFHSHHIHFIDLVLYRSLVPSASPRAACDTRETLLFTERSHTAVCWGSGGQQFEIMVEIGWKLEIAVIWNWIRTYEKLKVDTRSRFSEYAGKNTVHQLVRIHVSRINSFYFQNSNFQWNPLGVVVISSN